MKIIRISGHFGFNLYSQFIKNRNRILFKHYNVLLDDTIRKCETSEAPILYDLICVNIIIECTTKTNY